MVHCASTWDFQPRRESLEKERGKGGQKKEIHVQGELGGCSSQVMYLAHSCQHGSCCAHQLCPHTQTCQSPTAFSLRTVSQNGFCWIRDIEPLTGHDAAGGWQLTSHPLAWYTRHQWHLLRTLFFLRTLWKTEVFYDTNSFQQSIYHNVNFLFFWCGAASPAQLCSSGKLISPQ